jgi:hypothetical protein
MSTLTHLSDAELDAVTGGFTFVIANIAANLNQTEQLQENVAVLAIAKNGGNQVNVSKQLAIA